MFSIMYKRQSLGVLFVGSALFTLSLAGCSIKPSMDVDTFMSPGRAELHAESFEQRMPVAEVSPVMIQKMADYYNSHGMGAVELVVLYDPKSRQNTAMRAAEEAGRIAGALKRKGMNDISAEILPINKLGDIAEVVVNYTGVSAKPPSDCDIEMPGLYSQTEANMDYKYGCTVETMLAKQIARPKDLTGTNGLDPASGRRQNNIVSVYESGVQNSELSGESVSE